jgi:peptidoglycan/LPS O-acetylase OafA/YrhL
VIVFAKAPSVVPEPRRIVRAKSGARSGGAPDNVRRMKRAILGILLILAFPAAVAPFLHVEFIRTTAAPGFALQMIGLVLVFGAARREPQRRSLRVMSVVGVMLVLLAVFGWFFLSRLPEAPRFAELPAAPAIEAADVDGTTRSLAAATRDAPLLLVFFRGRW